MHLTGRNTEAFDDTFALVCLCEICTFKYWSNTCHRPIQYTRITKKKLFVFVSHLLKACNPWRPSKPWKHISIQLCPAHVQFICQWSSFLDNKHVAANAWSYRHSWTSWRGTVVEYQHHWDNLAKWTCPNVIAIHFTLQGRNNVRWSWGLK